MVTRGSKCDSWAALPPTILAIAEPLVGGGGQKDHDINIVLIVLTVKKNQQKIQQNA